MWHETERIQRMVTPGRVKTVMGCLLGQFQLCAVIGVCVYDCIRVSSHSRCSRARVRESSRFICMCVVWSDNSRTMRGCGEGKQGVYT